MSPDDREPERRISALEQQTSALKQQVTDLAHDIDVMEPIKTQIVEIRGTCRQIDLEVKALVATVREDREQAKARGAEHRHELEMFRKDVAEAEKARVASEAKRDQEHAVQSAETRKQNKTLAITVIIALIGAAATIVAAGLAG